jgi:hypothetical protein
MSITAKLMRIQTEIKAPKNLYNSFGKYKYRNAEGICEAVKPYLIKYACSLVLSDDIIIVGERIYVKATATLTDIESGETTSVSAMARESEEKKGMDESQITGTASSYARKYALNGLFLLDDTKDADTDEYHEQTHGKQTEADKAEAFDKQCEDIGKMKISKIKLDLIKRKCADDGVSEEKVLKLYKISRFEDMTEKAFMNAMNNWSKIKEA